ncbi:MAG: endonuclease III [Streptococcaceae bacterium]|jgi:endonuclease-3|nr:endonuclease III [Streptococcaceae bacterium]
MLSKKKIMDALGEMANLFPDAHGKLNARNPFELLIAVILSAQTTDVAVNKVTPVLFTAYSTPSSLAQADIEDVIEKIRAIGLYRNKAKNIIAASQMLFDEFNGEVPTSHSELMKLPGVGRKTANVVLGDAFGIPGIAVDTHVERIAKRLQIVKKDASVLEVEQALMKNIPKNLWVQAHHTMIFFGRYHCTAKKPKCANCPLLEMCAFRQKESS